MEQNYCFRTNIFVIDTMHSVLHKIKFTRLHTNCISFNQINNAFKEVSLNKIKLYKFQDMKTENRK